MGWADLYEKKNETQRVFPEPDEGLNLRTSSRLSMLGGANAPGRTPVPPGRDRTDEEEGEATPSPEEESPDEPQRPPEEPRRYDVQGEEPPGSQSQRPEPTAPMGNYFPSQPQGLEIRDVYGNLQQPMSPAQHARVQLQAQMNALPPAMRAAMMMEMTKLSMGEQIRLQRLQQGLAYIDSRDDLSAEDKGTYKMMLQTKINPLLLRHQRSQAAQEEMHTQQMQQAMAHQQAIEAENEKFMADSMPNGVRPWQNPVTGRVHFYHRDPKKGIQELAGTEKDAGEGKEDPAETRAVKAQDRAEENWHKIQQHYDAQVRKEIHDDMKNDLLHTRTAPDELEIQSRVKARMKSHNLAATPDEERAKHAYTKDKAPVDAATTSVSAPVQGAAGGNAPAPVPPQPKPEPPDPVKVVAKQQDEFAKAMKAIEDSNLSAQAKANVKEATTSLQSLLAQPGVQGDINKLTPPQREQAQRLMMTLRSYGGQMR